MTIRERNRQVLVDKRAHALAMMLLTRRTDLLIDEVNEEIGMNYVVRFRTPAKVGLREFGVALRAVWATATKAEVDHSLRQAMRQIKRHGPFLRPVCLFFFTMENDGAWYSWVAEPIASADGKTQLRCGVEPDCRPLDDRALSEIIARVDAWYDGMFPRVVVNGNGRGTGERKQAKR